VALEPKTDASGKIVIPKIAIAELRLLEKCHCAPDKLLQGRRRKKTVVVHAPREGKSL
jgi:hypothetical protein